MNLSLMQVNAMNEHEFMREFGDVAEHSPWVAKGAFGSRPFATRQDMIKAFSQILVAADEGAQLALICAHPDLAGKAKLTADSQSEQSGAGLDTLTAEELARFTSLNDAYKAKFNFPFIFAVKGATKHQILTSFEQRINNDTRTEFATALENIKRIFLFRIEDKVE